MLSTINEIKVSISNDDIPTAIQKVGSLNLKEADTDIIAISGRFASLKKKIRQGVISESDANLSRNKIRLAILDLVNELEVFALAKEVHSSVERVRSTKDTIRFVSSSRDKYDEYAKLLDPVSISFSQLNIDEIQDISVDRVVDRKVATLRSIFGDQKYFVDESSLNIHKWNGLPGPMTDQFNQLLTVQDFCRMLMVGEEKEFTATYNTSIGYFDGSKVRKFEGSDEGVIRIPEGDTVESFQDLFVSSQPATDNTLSRYLAAKKFLDYLLQQ